MKTQNTLRKISSPNGKLTLAFSLNAGIPCYQVLANEKNLILPSKLGFTLIEERDLVDNFTIAGIKTRTYDNTWTQPWGEQKDIREHYNELHITLKEETENPRTLIVVFRVFDDGIGFRYEFPKQAHLSGFQIADEKTELAFAGDHQAWSIRGMQSNRYEYLYTQAKLSTMIESTHPYHTPMTIETTDGLYLAIHEAALIDYPSMTLEGTENYTFKANLIPWADGSKAKLSTPHVTPWRTIQIAESAAALVTSYLILNLNEPNKLNDVSWIKPGKYIGIWWEMHLGLSTWASGAKHGATTENTKRYIDFAAEHGFSGVLVEGWNIGWDGDWVTNGDLFSFTDAYPDYDLEALVAYGNERGVRLIAHNETATGIHNYEHQLDDAFTLYQRLGINSIKTGYVGHGKNIRRLDKNKTLLSREWHHGQWMVNHYHKVMKRCAQYGLMINAHEPIKDTGLRRTYPNMMTREGARGQEYNAWSEDGGNPPAHTVTIPFTRMLASPMDFTPGIFDLLYEEAQPNNRVNTTLAKQLALYVILYSPLQMAADLPENYLLPNGNIHPMFQFIKDVPVDWETTIVPNGEIGSHITIVRKDRNSEDWYLGAATNEEARKFEISLDFLAPGHTYTAQIYADAPDTDWQENPMTYQIHAVQVDATTSLTLDLAPGGGTAIRFAW